MKIFFSMKYSAWEYDFFRNDLFSSNDWDVHDVPIEFVFYDEHTDVAKEAKEATEGEDMPFNILVFNHAFSADKIKQLIADIQPKVLFHMSEESKELAHIHSYLVTAADRYFHQYKHPDYDYPENCVQIPLGYVKNFCSGRSSLKTIQEKIRQEKELGHSPDRPYDASFIGQMKSDREEMCRVFQQGMVNTFFASGTTHWHDPELSNIKPNEMFDIYSKSKFVTIGRGNSQLDCFRVYEAIVAGAIPVMVGSMEEFKASFSFMAGTPICIIADTWDGALAKCKMITPEALYKFRLLNWIWWSDLVKRIGATILLDFDPALFRKLVAEALAEPGATGTAPAPDTDT